MARKMPFPGKATSHTALGTAIAATTRLLASPFAALFRATRIRLGVNIHKKGS